MTAKLLIAAAGLVVATGVLPATAATITSDPESAITEGQKLGPNERTMQLSNGFVTYGNRSHRSRVIAPPYQTYGYYQRPGYVDGHPLNVW